MNSTSGHTTSVGSSRARASAGLFFGLAAFQAALAAGAPWGAAAWGGRHPGVLPTSLRIASGVGTGFWVAVGALVVGYGPQGPGRRRALAGVEGLCGLAALANAASPSVPERALWTPYAAVQVLLLDSLRRNERSGSGP